MLFGTFAGTGMCFALPSRAIREGIYVGHSIFSHWRGEAVGWEKKLAYQALRSLRGRGVLSPGGQY
jgi:hypothetical protein